MTPKNVSDSSSVFGRRPFLKTVGAAMAGSVLLTGQAAAHPQYPARNPNTTTTFGESVDVVGDAHGDVWTFATTHEKSGKPLMLGVWMTKPGFDAITSGGSTHYHLDLPAVDGVPFTYAGIDWNEAGHPPAPVWTVPHFDFHFYRLDEAAVHDIPFGVATYSLPDSAVPKHYVTETPRLLIPAMGEHLFDEREAHDRTATHTLIYGAYDPSINPAIPSGTVTTPFGEVPTYEGDGTGELIFVEPMVTEAFMASLRSGRSEVRSKFPTPTGFAEAGYYPTSYAIRYYGAADAFLVTLEDFEWFEELDA